MMMMPQFAVLLALLAIIVCTTAFVSATIDENDIGALYGAVSRKLSGYSHKIQQLEEKIERFQSDNDALRASHSELHKYVIHVDKVNKELLSAVNDLRQRRPVVSTDVGGGRKVLSEATNDPSSSSSSPGGSRPGLQLNEGTAIHFVSQDDGTVASFKHENGVLKLNGTMDISSGGRLGVTTYTVPSTEYPSLATVIASLTISSYALPGRVEIYLASGNHTLSSSLKITSINRVGGVLIKGESSTTTFIQTTAATTGAYAVTIENSRDIALEDIHFRHIGTGAITALRTSGCERLRLTSMKFSGHETGMILTRTRAEFSGESIEVRGYSQAGILIIDMSEVYSNTHMLLEGTDVASSYGLYVYHASKIVHNSSVSISQVVYNVYAHSSSSIVMMSHTTIAPSILSGRYPIRAVHLSSIYANIKTSSGTKMNIHVSTENGGGVASTHGSRVTVFSASLTTVSGTNVALGAVYGSTISSLDDTIAESEFGTMVQVWWNSFIYTSNYGTVKRNMVSNSGITGLVWCGGANACVTAT